MVEVQIHAAMHREAPHHCFAAYVRCRRERDDPVEAKPRERVVQAQRCCLGRISGAPRPSSEPPSDLDTGLDRAFESNSTETGETCKTPIDLHSPQPELDIVE